MKTQQIILAAVLATGLLATSAFATTTAAHAKSTAAIAAHFDAPVLTQVVHPTGLAQRHNGETFSVAFTVDEKGHAHNIALMHLSDERLRSCMIKAISQWHFTPGRLNGTPVSTNIVLPIQLVAS